MKIELIPAIDIINGQCVRLTKGDYDQKTVYGEPLDMALEFERIGYKRLHVVDLDGAKSKHIVNSEVLRQITTETSLTVDFGGGIKTDEDIEKAFAAGAQMVTIGSIAVTQPELFMGWLERYGAEKIIPNYNIMGVAKAALEASVRYLANDLGERGIRVNSISAGPVKTLASSAIGEFRKVLGFGEAVSPMKRNITQNDVAKTAIYLLSDLSSGVTAENIHVDCGLSAVGMFFYEDKKDDVN